MILVTDVRVSAEIRGLVTIRPSTDLDSDLTSTQGSHVIGCPRSAENRRFAAACHQIPPATRQQSSLVSFK